MPVKLTTVVMVASLLFASAAVAEEPGQDNPLVSRFADAIMLGYQESDYDEIRLPTGPVPRAQYGRGGRNMDQAEDVLVLEGRVTWISYLSPEGKSTLEILRNYQQALEADGFSVLFNCAQQDQCGPGMSRYLHHIVYPDGYWTVRGRQSVRPGYNVSGNSRALLAKRDDAESAAHVFVYIDDEKDSPAIHQVVVEAESMRTDQVQTGVRQADELQAALDAEGKVVVDGVFFEVDSDAMRQESAAALEQMAQLLQSNPDMQVLIVGHTDNQGSLDYNTGLSQRRANSVRNALANDYAINRERLIPVGVGFAAPVASNGSDAGRALNRRVELVLR